MFSLNNLARKELKDVAYETRNICDQNVLRLHCNLTWHNAMHITYKLLFEMPLIWNAKGLFDGHLDWCVKWQLEWGVYFVNMKQNTSTGKQGSSSHWPMGAMAVSLNV